MATDDPGENDVQFIEGPELGTGVHFTQDAYVIGEFTTNT